MTVIVWDGTTLAADRQATLGELRRAITKISQEGGYFFAFAGSHSVGLLLKAWFLDGRNPAAFPGDLVRSDEHNTTLYVVDEKTGKTLCFESTHHPIEVEDKQWAFGSGRDFAYGAMSMGASAKEAVLIASQHCVTCGGGVDELTLKETV